jgi:hypothetical protein
MSTATGLPADRCHPSEPSRAHVSSPLTGGRASLRPSSRGDWSTSSPYRVHAGRASRQSTPCCASDTSPGRGTAPPPMSPTSEMVWCGARHGRRGTTAGRAPVRPATRGLRAVSRASARRMAGSMGVSRRATIDVPTPGGPRSRTLWTERLHRLQLCIHSLNELREQRIAAGEVVPQMPLVRLCSRMVCWHGR